MHNKLKAFVEITNSGNIYISVNNIAKNIDNYDVLNHLL